MAPEVIGGKGVNSAADVYSLGISTWEMFHRKYRNRSIRKSVLESLSMNKIVCPYLVSAI